MTYKDAIKREMEWLAGKSNTVFIGEGLINAGRIYNTLDNVPNKRCIEMPIAENLIAGAAIGLALEGCRPIVVFQRMDFMLIAADAIINHIALIPQMSGGKIKLPIIIRAIVGSRKKDFDVGLQHKHNFTHVFEEYLLTKEYVDGIYREAYKDDEPILIVEEKDRYDTKLGTY